MKKNNFCTILLMSFCFLLIAKICSAQNMDAMYQKMLDGEELTQEELWAARAQVDKMIADNNKKIAETTSKQNNIKK